MNGSTVWRTLSKSEYWINCDPFETRAGDSSRLRPHVHQLDTQDKITVDPPWSASNYSFFASMKLKTFYYDFHSLPQLATNERILLKNFFQTRIHNLKYKLSLHFYDIFARSENWYLSLVRTFKRLFLPACFTLNNQFITRYKYDSF